MCSRFAERVRGARGMALAMTLACCAFAGCERERRPFHDSHSGTPALGAVTMDTVHPGATAPAESSAVDTGPYGENAYALNDGKRLYEAYNCSGCHAHGGGGMGPPLMDAEWIYGSEPANIYATIVEGRPNGMPSFRTHIPPNQLWELVAYVRAMSGQGSKAARPNRSDEMEMRAAESQTTTQTPVQSSKPPASEHP
jgi:cytochrome c oxidase cbb3-type subunit 3